MSFILKKSEGWSTLQVDSANMRCLTLVLATIAGATAFQTPLVTHQGSLKKGAQISLRPQIGTVMFPQVIKTQPVLRGQHTAALATRTEALEIDERLFAFNKILIDTVYNIICFLYPVTGGPRDFARFYVLETVARVPYFAYLSVMHLRETFGNRDPKGSERMRTHYAEADNELHHLLIMESLGGNSSAVDRTIAQTMADILKKSTKQFITRCPLYFECAIELKYENLSRPLVITGT